MKEDASSISVLILTQSAPPILKSSLFLRLVRQSPALGMALVLLSACSIIFSIK